MGEEIRETHFTEDDFDKFRRLLKDETELLKQWFEQKRFVVEVMTVQGEDVTEEYFAVNNGILENRKPIMPSMFSTDAEIVGSDCLCYLMRRF